MFKCNICNKKFSTNKSMKCHYSSAHILRFKKIIITKICPKCENEFDVERTVNKDGTQNIRQKERKFCNRKCANNHIQTNEQNIARSSKLKGSLGSNWKGGIYQKIKCKTCGKEITSNEYGFCMKCLRKTKQFHKLLSESIKGKSGGYRKGSGISKGGYYKNNYFDSQFEIEVAKFLDYKNIKWIRNTKRFYFNWKRKKTYYIPDFYLSEYDSYLETKGYWYSDKKERTLKAVKVNNLNWILLMQKSEWNIDKNILLEKLNK